MIEYEAGNLGICFAFRLRGSVFPKSFGFAMACALVTVSLHWWLSRIGKRDDFDIGSKGTTVASMFTFVLGFLLVFRTQQAYSRWWEGGSLLQELRGEWFNAYSCLLAFGNPSPDKTLAVQKFNHMLARLLSMLHGASLAEVCSMNEKRFDVIDLEDFDIASLTFLDNTFDSCEVILQWIQRLIGDAERQGILKVAPPILSRVYNQLGSGIVKLSKARKIAKFPIPFPFAQMVTIMLLTHWLMAAIVCATSIESQVWAGVLCFAVVISFWSMNFIALELEDPFGDDANDLPLIDMQNDMNASIKALLAPPAMSIPDFNFNLAYHGELNIKDVDFSRFHESVEAIHQQRPKDVFEQAEKRKAEKEGVPHERYADAPDTVAEAPEHPAPELAAAQAPTTPGLPPSSVAKGVDLSRSLSNGVLGASVTQDSSTAAEHMKTCKGMEQQLSRAVAQLERNGSQLEKNSENQKALYELHCDFWGLLTTMFQRRPPHPSTWAHDAPDSDRRPPLTLRRTSSVQAHCAPDGAPAARSELRPILAARECTGSSSISEHDAVAGVASNGDFSIV